MTRLVCPGCGRFLVESNGSVSLPCAGCGARVTFEPKGLKNRPLIDTPQGRIQAG